MKQTDLNVLAASDIFSGLTQTEIAAIAEYYGFGTVSCKKHEFIFTPDKYETALAVILKGSADVYKQTTKGPLFLSILSQGSVFGMAAMFYEKNGFINTVCAREDCRILFISKEDLCDIFVRYPVCAENYITVLSRKIHYLNEKIAFLTSPAPTARLLAWLTDESERQGKDEFTLPISYSELASLLSMGRTSLYRSFDELTQTGKLTRNGKTITLIKQ